MEKKPLFVEIQVIILRDQLSGTEENKILNWSYRLNIFRRIYHLSDKQVDKYLKLKREES